MAASSRNAPLSLRVIMKHCTPECNGENEWCEWEGRLEGRNGSSAETDVWDVIATIKFHAVLGLGGGQSYEDAMMSCDAATNEIYDMANKVFEEPQELTQQQRDQRRTAMEASGMPPELIADLELTHPYMLLTGKKWHTPPPAPRTDLRFGGDEIGMSFYGMFLFIDRVETTPGYAGTGYGRLLLATVIEHQCQCRDEDGNIVREEYSAVVLKPSPLQWSEVYEGPRLARHPQHRTNLPSNCTPEQRYPQPLSPELQSQFEEDRAKCIAVWETMGFRRIADTDYWGRNEDFISPGPEIFCPRSIHDTLEVFRERPDTEQGGDEPSDDEDEEQEVLEDIVGLAAAEALEEEDISSLPPQQRRRLY
ncbi:unnamed protein product [Amoebophrya sp. A120]|nr:unnamed protein product [Amoebophrya sp. A120]|eukprot:GSA120T00004810001.1